MLTALRRRLWLLMTTLTGAVLGAALVAGCSMAQHQQRQAAESSFLQLCGQLAQQIESGAVLRTTTLSLFEAQHQLTIGLVDGGVPVHLLSGWQSGETKNELLELAAAYAPPNLPLFGASGSWQLTGPDGRTYRALAARIPLHSGDCRLTVLQNLGPLQTALRRTARNFTGLFLAGLALLAVTSRVLAGLAIRPTAKSIRRQAEFVAAAGHELRTPVAAIGASLEVMEAIPPAEARQCLRAALAETKRLGRLVEDLLVLAGADTARLRWAPGPVDADSVLIDTCEQFRPLAQKRGFTLKLELPQATLPPLRGDAARLQQILTILLENATCYAPPGTVITLRGCPGRHTVRFEVADHGPGVAPADRQRIFGRFYRAEQSRTGGQHFGLGLSVAQELTALHKGTLTVQDVPGGGALFRLELPIEAHA